jgi:hypothetical protein
LDENKSVRDQGGGRRKKMKSLKLPISAPGLYERIQDNLLVGFNDIMPVYPKVVVYGFFGDDLDDLMGDLCEYGFDDLIMVSGAGQLLDPEAQFSDSGLALINLDAFVDLSTGINSLIEFRKRQSDLKVLLFSSDVVRDDYGQERIAICDVTLSLPVSRTRFYHALQAITGDS